MKTLVQQSHSVHSGQFTLKMGVVEKNTASIYYNNLNVGISYKQFILFK